MHKHPMTMGNLGNLSDRLQCASLVVGLHYSDQDCLSINSCLHVCRADTSICIHWQIGNAQSMHSLKSAADIEHSRRLRDLRNDMVAGRAPCHGYSPYSQFISFLTS